MEQETAVKWFNQQLIDRQNGIGDSRSWDEIVEQAKQMEKDQLTSAMVYGAFEHSTGLAFPIESYVLKDADRWYQQTFK